MDKQKWGTRCFTKCLITHHPLSLPPHLRSSHNNYYFSVNKNKFEFQKPVTAEDDPWNNAGQYRKGLNDYSDDACGTKYGTYFETIPNSTYLF